MLKDCFIDYLDVTQTHDIKLPELSLNVDVKKPLPLFGTGLRCGYELNGSNIDIEDIQYVKVANKKVEGSYDTSFQISCDGSTVFFQGNASKFGRLDNLFGHTDIDSNFKLINSVLDTVGLPPFTKATYFEPSKVVNKNEEHITFFHDGATIRRFDLTKNHSFGCESNVAPGLRGIAAHPSPRKAAFLHPNGRTVSWYSSQGINKGMKAGQWSMSKLYDKAYEMMLNKIKYKITSEDQKYLDKLIEYIKVNGCAREEHTLRLRLLKRHNAHIYGIVTETLLDELFNKVRTMMTKSEATITNYQNVKHDLLSNGIVESVATANRLQAIVYTWMAGEDMKALSSSESVFYANKSILSRLGIDIGKQFNPSRMNVKIQLLDLKPFVPPAFYRYPNVAEQLRIVA